MSGGGGLGAVLDALARTSPVGDGGALSRIQARRAYLQAMYGDTWQPNENFACYYICASCGQLAEEDNKQACNHCGDSLWYDLRNSEFASQIAEEERNERANAPFWLANLSWFGGGLLSVIVTLLGLEYLGPIIFDNKSNPILVLAFWPCFAIVAMSLSWYLFEKWIITSLMPNKEIQVQRWRAPIHPNKHKDPKRFQNAHLEASTEHLLAPFSGEECLAYRVTIVASDPHDGQKPFVTLDEQHNIELSANGQAIEKDSAFLRLSLKMLNETQLQLSDEELAKFLRKRGITPDGVDLTFFEATLLPGQSAYVGYHKQLPTLSDSAIRHRKSTT